MRRAFIESSEFTEWVREYLSDEGLLGLQKQLSSEPDKGDVMPGCGGLRKLRIADPKRGKGKRGGGRLIYLDVPEAGVIYLLDIYSKDEKDDLTVQEKRILRDFAERFKMEAIRVARRRRK